MERRNILGPRLVGWGRQDWWNRDFLVALGPGRGYWEGEHSRRIAAADFDKGHTVVEDSLERMDIPEERDILA